MPLDIQKEFEDIKKMYSESAMQRYVAFLVYGGAGAGKTRLLSTCRRPIHIDSFDPHGTANVQVKKGIQEGWILADARYEEEDPFNPTKFVLWDKEYERRRNGGYFDSIGTYCVDSATLWEAAAMNEVLKKAKGGSRAGSQPFEQDYLPAMYMIRNAIKDFISLPCDVVLTAHENVMQDEATGKMYVTPLFVGKKQNNPVFFSELYYLQSTRTSTGIKYSMLTQSDGTYRAKTRIGEGIFSQNEEPDIKKLLVKAGYSTEDKK